MQFATTFYNAYRLYLARLCLADLEKLLGRALPDTEALRLFGEFEKELGQ